MGGCVSNDVERGNSVVPLLPKHNGKVGKVDNLKVALPPIKNNFVDTNTNGDSGKAVEKKVDATQVADPDSNSNSNAKNKNVEAILGVSAVLQKKLSEHLSQNPTLHKLLGDYTIEDILKYANRRNRENLGRRGNHSRTPSPDSLDDDRRRRRRSSSRGSRGEYGRSPSPGYDQRSRSPSPGLYRQSSRTPSPTFPQLSRRARTPDADYDSDDRYSTPEKYDQRPKTTPHPRLSPRRSGSRPNSADSKHAPQRPNSADSAHSSRLPLLRPRRTRRLSMFELPNPRPDELPLERSETLPRKKKRRSGRKSRKKKKKKRHRRHRSADTLGFFQNLNLPKTLGNDKTARPASSWGARWSGSRTSDANHPGSAPISNRSARPDIAHHRAKKNEYITFHMSAEKLDNCRVLGIGGVHSFVRISRYRTNIWERVTQTEVIPDDANPEYGRIIIQVQKLCYAQYNRPLRVECWEENNGHHTLIGEIVQAFVLAFAQR